MHVRQVISNEASFQRLVSAAPAPHEAHSNGAKGRGPASHALVVEPRRAYDEGDDHGCELCPANLCKVSVRLTCSECSECSGSQMTCAWCPGSDGTSMQSTD